ncbi:MAG: hypothetical protein F6J86_12835 [Symploca sp. SIO1B1]|nr:hypothetical protein [Symploca sp. SIO1C2]NER94705.1 hypothetical protein [Symploca sp. SIO1B1]
MFIEQFVFLFSNYVQFIYQIIINLLHYLQFRDYIIALTLGLGLWNFYDSRQKFASLNYPTLNPELRKAPYGSFPIYPNYKITNNSDKKALDIDVTVKIAYLGKKWKFWKNQWIIRHCDKLDKLEPNEVSEFLYYQKEYIFFHSRRGDGKTTDEYHSQKYLENVPIDALITVSYKPTLFKAKKLSISKVYKLILRCSHTKKITKYDFLRLMPLLLKIDKQLCLSCIYQIFVYRNLLPKLELSEMCQYQTHYWELQEVEQGWQLPFRKYHPKFTSKIYQSK